MSQVRKVRLDKDKTGSVEFGIREMMTSPEVADLLAHCKAMRDKEAALGLKPDPYMALFKLPTVLYERLQAEYKGKLKRPFYLQKIIERDYPAFKTTNYKLPITQ